MSRQYFGTDGIRGTVGQAPITPDFVLRLGHAVGQVLRRTETRPTVLIGKDTRISGYMLESALEAGFASAGVDVLLTGPLPTPGVAYLTRLRGYQAGVVVSASHNPCEDNGVKFFSATGDKLPDGMEADIERTMDQPMVCLPSSQLGRVSQLPEASSLYIEFCRKAVPAGVHLRGMKIVVDAAHGACHRIAPEVFRQLGAEVIAVGASPDGQNINDKVGATSPQHLSAAVLAHQADVGVALDGDGDRLVMVDSDGRIFAGDELLYVLAVDAQTNDGLQGGVVGTVMSNQGLELALQRRGIGFARSAVGDRHVLELLKQRGWRLGGEGSGHLIGLDWHSTGDGVMSALRVVAAMQRSQRSLAQLCGDLRMNAQCLVNVPVAPGAGMGDGAWIPHFQLRAEQALGDDGRMLLRASGTEPVVRVLVECRTALRAQQMASRFAQEVCQLLALPVAPQTATA